MVGPIASRALRNRSLASHDLAEAPGTGMGRPRLSLLAIGPRIGRARVGPTRLKRDRHHGCQYHRESDAGRGAGRPWVRPRRRAALPRATYGRPHRLRPLTAIDAPTCRTPLQLVSDLVEVACRGAAGLYRLGLNGREEFGRTWHAGRGLGGRLRLPRKAWIDLLEQLLLADHEHVARPPSQRTLK